MVKDEWKAAARANRKSEWREQRRHDRAERRRRLRCFWRWPLGHEYVVLHDKDGNEVPPFMRCVSCEKPGHRHVR